MTLEKFKKILNLQAEHYQKEQKIYELGLVLCDLNDCIQSVVAGLWSEVLTEKGEEVLDWFLFEKFWISGEPNEDIKAYDSEGNDIIRNIDELHGYLTVNSYFRAKKVQNTCTY